jgi:hypothetical protein
VRNKRAFMKFALAGGVTAVLGAAVRNGFTDPPEPPDPVRTAKAAGVLVAATWLIASL